MDDRPDDGSPDGPQAPPGRSTNNPDGESGGAEGGDREGALDEGSGDAPAGNERERPQSASDTDAGPSDTARARADVGARPRGEGPMSEQDRRRLRQRGTAVGEDRPDPEPGTRAGRGTSRPQGWMGFAYDVATSILAVLLVGGFLFAVSGVWPPLVAVESGSMQPNMQKGDLVFVMEEERFPGTGAVDGTGVVTARSGEESGYRQFNGYGDVIVFKPNGSETRTPIIHRAMLYVEEGENWVARANPEYLESAALVCERVDQCPAPYDGFITKGDNDRSNRDYDQVSHLSPIVKPEWVVGTAELRLPGLGWIRLGSQ